MPTNFDVFSIYVTNTKQRIDVKMMYVFVLNIKMLYLCSVYLCQCFFFRSTTCNNYNFNYFSITSFGHVPVDSVYPSLQSSSIWDGLMGSQL